MPKCYMCQKEQAVLKSRIYSGNSMGFAVCTDCDAKADKEEGKANAQQKHSA